MVEVYVRGNSIKYVTIPEEVLDMVQEEDLSKESELTNKNLPRFLFRVAFCFFITWERRRFVRSTAGRLFAAAGAICLFPFVSAPQSSSGSSFRRAGCR